MADADTVTEGSEPRTRLKITAIVALITLLLGIAGGWAVAAVLTRSPQGDLWVIAADSAVVSAESIALTNPAPAVVGVTLADGREASQSPISKVVQQWEDQFGDTAPRAILVGTNAGGSHSVIVELSEPTATADTLTFPAVGIGGTEVPEFEATQAILVIDGAGAITAAQAGALAVSMP
ncbi:hypothetical protein [Demequina sp.]|uniref:hypothetical protein n=1 Tax=Demequina sp. TaxID=2050685 RepID=UPI003A84BFF7